MFKKILVVLLIAIVVFLCVVALLPADYRITRAATISAPSAAVFEQVNDFHKWNGWSPWAKLDPAAKNTFDGAASGVGAIFSWAGNDKVGEGKMTLTESHPDELIRIKLDFVKPFENSANTEFTFKPVGDQILVTWSMAGKNNFVGRAVCVFVNMDKMLGADFEKGLAQLKTVAEASVKK